MPDEYVPPLFAILVFGVFLGALISLVWFIPALRRRIQRSLPAKILGALLSGSIAAGILYQILVTLAKLAISLALTSNLTTAQEFLTNQELLDRTIEDVYWCERAPSRHVDACGHTENYRWLISDATSEFVSRMGNPAIYLTPVVGSVLIIAFIDRVAKGWSAAYFI
jgi:hypothetical protein